MRLYNLDDDLLDSLDWLSQRGRDDLEALNHYGERMRGFFGDLRRARMARDIGLFIQQKLDVPVDYQRPGFIRYLMDRQTFTIKRIVWRDGEVDYEIGYYGRPFENEDGVVVRPPREIKTIDGGLNDVDEHQCVDDLDYLYDKWRAIERNRRLRRAGIVRGIIVGVTGLITGLALGLKRAGHRMQSDAKSKWRKLTPAKRKKVVIPWTEIEKAGGGAIISLGSNIYLVIVSTIIYLIVKD